MSVPCPISILIPVKNERDNLRPCLESCRFAADVVVVDSGSMDGTREIAAEFGARVVDFRWNGVFPKKKNWALANVPWQHEWVFILDADERITPELAEDLRQIVAGQPGGAAACDGYYVNRRFWFLDGWLMHCGYYPSWNLRFFRHRLGRYEKLTDVETASGDNEVHEHIVVQGETGRLKAEMDHYAFPSVDVFVEKHNRYSNWEARVTLDRALKGSAGQIQSADVGWRRRLKALSQKLPFRPLQRFLYVYVFQKGFLDGAEGYYFARLHAFYEFLCVAKTHELAKSRRVN